MCRIISFVSAAGGLGKSSIINLLANSLSEGGFSVCIFDGVFTLNMLSAKYENSKILDLSNYLVGDINSNLVLNKINENLYYVKTDNATFDYLSKSDLIQRFINDISFNFDYILIDTSSYDIRNISLFLGLSSEVFVVTSHDGLVIKNTKKLVQKINYYKNITNKKIILNKQKIIGEINGKKLNENFIEAYLGLDIIFAFPKFLKHNIFEWGKGSIYYKSFSERFEKSVIQNKFIPTNYKDQYLGLFGKFRRILYEKYE